MSRFIVKHTMDGTDLFQVWSTIVDAPITGVGDLADLRAYWREEYGRQGIEDLERRMEAPNGRAFSTIDDAVTCNRAGKDGTRLTKQQVVDYYFVARGLDDPPLGRHWSEIPDDDDDEAEEEERCSTENT